ncbi:MAG: ABC transporter permease [Anaerolineae bacterium]|jgi:peptide/nickel transport system permease protein|nr:ABC transporter permease [Chloroflexota bacterium]MBV6437969.1 Dipeptide transport system permease protein DppB [Anaerolineae bacterium]MDL1915897.1 ABC transporter permease [Anaerolineae bacterium CFX4]OQY81557.1 MAG: hypothetical protein B6D42_10955 [Anaerolineae bacterium UTCFX5]MBW7880118.1 ABC transporter permease [Anaerolineae bacterium]
MGKYIIQRILQAIPLLIIISIVVFSLMKLAGDPFAYLAQDPRATPQDRALMRAKYGLDDPLPVQYITWLVGDDWRMRDKTGDGELDSYGDRRGVLRGDLGESIVYGRTVGEVFSIRLPNTLILMVTQYVVTIFLALFIGIFAALRKYTVADNIITGISFVLFSMPVFLLALLLVQVFAVQFKHLGLPYLPVSGMYDPRGDRSIDELVRHLILPVASLAAISIAGYSRYIRATMLEVINSDYIRTARAKGLSERRITFLHALKNASLPLVTLVALDVPFLLGGAVITETIFSWPGMGTAFIEALRRPDMFLIISFVLMTAVAVVVFQIIADIVYSWLDPRIRYN